MSNHQNRETVRIASTRYRIAIRSLSDSSRYLSNNFISSRLSRRLRRPLAKQGKRPNISVMPCTFVIDDVLLYVRENFKNRIALSFLFVAGLKGRSRS
jgi:Zn-finger domain-containing protein